jgi:tyrosyl-tRNA synthetase
MPMDKVTLYIGIDPTGESLHLGHLLGVLLLKRAALYGAKVIVIVGGGTSLIGDPSGRDAERPMVDMKVIEANKQKLKTQLARFVKFDDDKVKMVDNAEWLTSVSLIGFLREVGKYISVSSMMDKESVKMRLDREQGLSFAEFSYQLLQAYDFLMLFDKYGCNLQIGGSDQWGNIVQGVDLIRKRTGKVAHGLSFPLIVDPKTGKKFGKTEKGAAIWLDATKTHPFEMYQFLVNVSDDLAPILLKYYSFKNKSEIESLISVWQEDKGNRRLQKELAYELVKLVHGEDVANQSRRVAGILFDREVGSLTEEDFVFVEKVVPCLYVSRKDEADMIEDLVELGLVESKSEARRLTEQGGVTGEWFFERFYLIKKGKKDYGLIRVK